MLYHLIITVMKKDKIGENAGLVWRTLFYKGGGATMNELMDSTGLDVLNVSAAIGWLARENKIEFYTKDGEEFFDVIHEMYY